MFTLWGKLIRENKILKSDTVQIRESDTRTHKIFAAMEKLCRLYDLSSPIWLKSNISDFKATKKTRFSKDNFIDDIDFDYMEIQIIEE